MNKHYFSIIYFFLLMASTAIAIPSVSEIFYNNIQFKIFRIFLTDFSFLMQNIRRKTLKETKISDTIIITAVQFFSQFAQDPCYEKHPVQACIAHCKARGYSIGVCNASYTHCEWSVYNLFKKKKEQTDFVS